MAHDAIVKKMATQKLDANNDMVKKLHSLGARAAAFTVRDKQVTARSVSWEMVHEYLLGDAAI